MILFICAIDCFYKYGYFISAIFLCSYFLRYVIKEVAFRFSYLFTSHRPTCYFFLKLWYLDGLLEILFRANGKCQFPEGKSLNIWPWVLQNVSSLEVVGFCWGPSSSLSDIAKVFVFASLVSSRTQSSNFHFHDKNRALKHRLILQLAIVGFFDMPFTFQHNVNTVIKWSIHSLLEPAPGRLTKSHFSKKYI